RLSTRKFGPRVRTMSQESLDSGDVARACRGHERRLAVAHGAVWISAGPQEQLDHGRTPIGTGQKEWRDTEGILGLRVRARPDQKLGGLQVVSPGGPVQCCRAIGLRGIDVCTLLKKEANCRTVSLFDGIDQSIAVASGPEARDGK